MGDWEKLSPLVVYIQASLDQDLSLTVLGERAGLSPTHLQRVFKAVIGETPKGYVTRLRVERAAFCLLAHESSIAQIGAECGFRNPETFIRAFRRRFGVSPREYRSSAFKTSERNDKGSQPIVVHNFELSTTRLVEIRPIHIAFRRHLGPYEDVPDTIFDELERWAVRQRLNGPRIWMGIGHDAPFATTPEQLRFDAALAVPGPFDPDGLVGYQLLPGGTHAITTHAGPYETLGVAYAKIFRRLASFKNYTPVGLPALEIYHTAKVNARLALNFTDICLPMRRE